MSPKEKAKRKTHTSDEHRSTQILDTHAFANLFESIAEVRFHVFVKRSSVVVAYERTAPTTAYFPTFRKSRLAKGWSLLCWYETVFGKIRHFYPSYAESPPGPPPQKKKYTWQSQTVLTDTLRLGLQGIHQVLTSWPLRDAVPFTKSFYIWPPILTENVLFRVPKEMPKNI